MAKSVAVSVKIVEEFDDLRVPIESLNLDVANARVHDRKNIEAIKSSLARFGQRLPVVVQREGRIVRAGNGRVVAARELGWDEIAAVLVDESNIDAAAFAIADNRTAELAEWDDEALAAVLRALEADDALPEGWDDDELSKLLDAQIPIDDLVDVFGKAAVSASTADGVVGMTSVTLVLAAADAVDVKAAVRQGVEEFGVKVGNLARDVLTGGLLDA